MIRSLAAAALAVLISMPVFAQTATSPRTAPAAPAVSTPAAPVVSTPPQKGVPATASTSQGKLIDINSASASELDGLPGVGKARAEAIIKNRPYRGKDDLASRHVIPQNVYNGIKDKIIARQG